MRIEKLDQNTKKDLLEKLLKRSPTSYGSYEQSVREILDDVRDRRDQALFEYTEKFDGARISADNILVTEEEIREAYREVDPELVEIIRHTRSRVLSRETAPVQLVRQQAGRHDPGAEGDSAHPGRRLCPRRGKRLIPPPC